MPGAVGCSFIRKNDKTLGQLTRVRWIKVHPTRPVEAGQGTGFIRFMSLERARAKPGRTHADVPTVARLSGRAQPATGPMKRAGLSSQY